ncbi:MAG: hypothetical protein EHM46_05670, partial [Bacteroidetes bacterium]
MPVYTGDSLRNIFYPLGGMGTGNILVGGRGNILEWEIFNRAQRDELPPYMTFFSIWCREEGSEPVSRVLERRHFDDFANGFGVPRQQLAGLPRFEEAAWSGAPPLVSIKLEDNTVPLEISLECFNPLIPLAVDASSYPAGEFNWIVRNPGKNRVDFSLAFFLSNPFRNLNYRGNEPGYPVRCSSLSDASRNTGDSPGLEAGATGNRPGSWNGLFLENLVDPASPDFGNMAVASDHPGMVLNTGLVAERWWDDAHLIWGRFSEDGGLAPREEPVNHTGRGEVVSSLLARGTLEPGGTDTVRFLVAWYVPNRELEESQAFGSGEIAGHVTRNYYSLGFKDAREVMHRYLDERRELHRLSDRFRERMAASTVPGPVLDAAASNLAILKSNLVSRMENGDLHGYEGLGPDFGCCPGNCTHVWNYAQSLASLFPSLERNVRETAYLTQTFESGYQCFRTTFPIGDSHFRNVAADGQMGNIMRAYREWKFSGDSTWLARLWPAVKRSLEYAWSGTIPGSRENEWQSEGNAWDPGRRGVLSGKQHNTYDVDFYGPNMLTGSL